MNHILAATGSALSQQYAMMAPALLILGFISAILLLSGIIITIMIQRRRKADEDYRGSMVLPVIIFIATAVALFSCVFCALRFRAVGQQLQQETTVTTEPTTEPTTESTTEPVETTIEETTEPTTEATEPAPTYTPEMTEDSDPANWNIKWEIITPDGIVSEYNRADPIHFGDSSEYSPMAGITTFRGDNYRTGPTYGTAKVEKETISTLWHANIGSFNGWPAFAACRRR